MIEQQLGEQVNKVAVLKEPHPFHLAAPSAL